MFHAIKFGLDSGAQAQVVSALSQDKIPYIQTSDGLCVKASRETLAKILEGTGLRPQEINQQDEVPPDVRAFIDS